MRQTFLIFYFFHLAPALLHAVREEKQDAMGYEKSKANGIAH